MPQRQSLTLIILDDNLDEAVPTLRSGLADALEIRESHIHHYNMVNDFLDRGQGADPDVIFLDVEDMDLQPKKAIPDIHRVWPRIPVIILTAHGPVDLNRLAGYWNFDGARGYLNREALRHSSLVLAGQIEDSGDEAAAILKAAANLILMAAEEYQPTKRALKDSRQVGVARKESRSEGEPADVVRAQIDFLRRIQQADNLQPISYLFPPVLHEFHHRLPSYEIPYYRARSLRRRLLAGTSVEDIVSIAQAVLPRILSELKNILFERTSEELKDDDWDGFAERFYIGKLKRRLGTLTREGNTLDLGEVGKLLNFGVREKKPSSQETYETYVSSLQKEGLEHLMTANVIRVGAEKMQSPRRILEELMTRDDIRQALMPSRIGLLHGDLHFDNILIDAAIIERPFVKLVDPRGFTDPGNFRPGADFAYDIGKLLHSCIGKYDFIDEGYLQADASFSSLHVDYDGDDKIVFVHPLVHHDWVSRGEKGGSGATVTSYSQDVTQMHFDAFDEISVWLMSENGPIDHLMAEDRWWRERAELNNALHFLTMGPFHLLRNPMKVFATYIRGVELMNRVARRWDLV